jgi:hypothetical protein
MSDKRQSQADRIRQLLEKYAHVPDRYVTLPMILNLGIASHTRRIHELRKAGYNIEMIESYADGQRRTAYRLIPNTPEERQAIVSARSAAFQKVFKKRCDWCKKRFESSREDAECCSDACRSARWKKVVEGKGSAVVQVDF